MYLQYGLSRAAEKNAMMQQSCVDLQGEAFAQVVHHNKLIFGD